MAKFVSVVVLAVMCLCSCGPALKQADVQVGETESDALSLLPAPWVDGEMMRLKINSMQGNEWGTMIYSAEEIEGDNPDKSGWRIVSQNYISGRDTQQYTVVEARQKSFVPLSVHVVNFLGDFEAEYRRNKIGLHSRGAAGDIKREVDVNSIVYDNEQLVYLIRRLPLQEGYRISFKIFAVMSGQVVDCAVEAADKEKVTVAAGTFDCYKINLSLVSGGEKPLEHILWFSADEHRYLVKYIAGISMILELAEVSQVEKEAPISFSDEQLNFALAIPAGWRYYRHAMGDTVFVELLAPELKAKAALCILAAEGADGISEIVRKDVDRMKKLLKDYAVRGDRFDEVQVGGLKAAQYVADFKEEANALRKYPKPIDMVEYRTYMLSSGRVYLFVFRSEVEKFEEERSEFDAIIHSFALKQ